MTIKVYIWKSPAGSIINYIAYTLKFNKLMNFETSVGHASLEIETPKITKYISHRPKGSEHINKEFLMDLNDQKVLFDNITYGIEANNRKKNGYEIYKTYTFEGLNELAIINAYNEGIVQGGEYSYYHGLNNNCCKVIFKLIKEGLGCPKGKTCFFCDHENYGLSLHENPFRRRLHIALEASDEIIKDFCNSEEGDFQREFSDENKDWMYFLYKTLKMANGKIIEAWTPTQIVNFLTQIENTSTRTCILDDRIQLNNENTTKISDLWKKSNEFKNTKEKAKLLLILLPMSPFIALFTIIGIGSIIDSVDKIIKNITKKNENSNK